ncbi:MAG: helix-turn-helix domain-containing protein [Thermoplasmata archaeon]
MAKRGLTENEKHVLYGLVHNPILNDREQSEILGVKVSTVTAIRRRLRRADYFVTRRLPMMHRLGWEILAGGHARIDNAQGPPGASRLREVLKDRLPSLFHVTVSSDHLTFLAAAPNYTALRQETDELRLILDKAKLLGEGDVATTVFPMSLCVVPTFFDYSHSLALAFGLDERISFKPEYAKHGDVDLTRKETEVLKGLVRYPEMSDKALAQKVKVSRQAVSKMRREFEDEGVLRTVRIPNLRALGFELYVTSFAHFTPSATVKARTEAIEKLLQIAPTFFLASSDQDAVLVGAARSYEQFSNLRSTITKYHEDRGFLLGDPNTYLALTSNLDILRNCEFAPLMGALTDRVARAPG